MPEFEAMLVRSGMQVVKYWFSVSDEEQERRFDSRARDPKRRWKLSEMDIAARGRWVDFSRAKDAMFQATDSGHCPWWVVEADEKRRARLNCISHLLETVPYEDVLPARMQLPPRPPQGEYRRPPRDTQRYVPDRFS